jgi:endonuclease/exonuclease/phosphatase family metal-dependent hydrolase
MAAQQAIPFMGDRIVSVMTRNVYHGVDAEIFSNCQIPTARLRPITIRRGWVAVDAKIRGQSFRLVSTHLDGDCCPSRHHSSRLRPPELLANPAATDLPLVLVGDFNSPGDGTGVTCNALMAARFKDAWTLAGGGGDGRTCCQADDLLNAVSTLDRRIDLVLFRDAVTPLAATVVGNRPVNMTPSLMMWPSDHAGVAATLRLRQP